MPQSALSVMVVDDDPLARSGLEEMLRSLPGVRHVGSAASGGEAVARIDELAPALLVLDISLPDMNGFELAERIPRDIDIVFATAFDTYAVAAFELNALDYILKPVRRERLEQSLSRAAQGEARERARRLADPGPPLTRIFVRSRERITPLEVACIERLEARDDYVAIFANGARYLVHTPLGDLLFQLEPTDFVRVHRSHAVNLRHVTAFRSMEGGRLQVELRSGAKIMASRDWSQALRSVAL